MIVSLSLFDANGLSIYILIGAGSVVIAAIVSFTMILTLKSRFNPFKRAGKQYEKGRYEKVLLLLAVELDKNPDNRKALLLKADAECRLERYDEAARDYGVLIQAKQTGDGIDVLDVKKRLLSPLYGIESLLELYNLCMEILKEEANSPEALYYLSLLYVGQGYFDIASETLHRLTHNRPGMRDAYFILGLADAQRGQFAEAVDSFNQALKIAPDNLTLLCAAACHYFNGEYTYCNDRLKKIPQRPEAFALQKQYLFSLRLRAFSHYRSGHFDRAVGLLQLVYNMHRQKMPRNSMVYDSSGKLKGEDDAAERPFDEYYRLREVAAEQGRNIPPPKKQSGLLDLKGLFSSTEAGLDLSLAMFRAGSLTEARELMADLRRQQPEVLGLKRLIDLFNEETERIESVRSDTPQSFRSASTERVLRGKGRGYKLWEYMEEWERRAVRPFELLIIAGVTSRKMLSPGILLSRRGKGQ